MEKTAYYLEPVGGRWVLSRSSLVIFCKELWSEKGLGARDLYVGLGLLQFEKRV